MFNNASNTDARHSTFSEVHRDQFNALRLSTLRKQNVRYSAIVHGDQIFQLQATNTDRSTLTEYLLGTALIDVRCDGQNVCLDGTRVSLLSEIKNWADNSDPHSSRIFWLHGVAGTGKSTIANTIAHYYTTGRLGASFQFKRKVEGLNKPTSLFGHIAYQLANSNAKFMTHCLEAIRQYGRMNAFSLKEQLDRYIIVPLRQMESLSVILIVIDAIDECSDVGDRRGVLEAVMGVLPAFPACAKLLIASRYEPDIRAQLGTHCLSKSINDIHDTAGDISLYISARMVKIIQHHPHLHMHWPGEKMKEELVRLAEGLFIWASVACDHIQNSSDPMVPLWYLTSREGARPSSGGERALDALYMSILNQASSGLSSSDLRFVIGAIVTAKTSLTPQELDLLLGLNRSVLGHPIWLQDGSRIELTTSASVIAALGSMLRIDDGYIRVLHTSIFDFFTSPTRCTDPRFHINTTLFSHFLAARCFRSMCALKRDVCDINDPTQMNSDIVGLDQRLKEKMPEHIRYSCSYWHLHLADVPGVHLGLYEEAKTFLFTHLLHWFEVMSLRGDVDGIFIALNRVKPWFQRHPASDEVLQLCDDAIRFLQQFHVVMRQSASHIYISALPFTSQKSSIFRSFAHTLERVPKMLMSHRTSVEPLTTFSIRLVGSIKVAPNGSCLTYAHDGKTLQIWDADTCSPIGEPLVGHQSAIHRVYFSLDDPLVASSDEQGVTFVWDIERYVAVGGPFQRSDDVEEVIEISLVDGHVIVLFRYYNHVMVWNYITGEPAASYETGGVASLHGAYVLVSNEEHASFLDTSDFDPQSILYAPTGKDTTPAFVRMRASGNITFPVHDQLRRVMCWSSDSEIQLVDIATGGPIGDPISIPDHNNWHFSPCGRWIATHWNHIRIHSTRTGEFLFSSSGEFAQHASRWSIDGAHLLIRCGYSTTMPQFEVWDMEAMEPVGTLQLPSGHEIIAASSQRIVTINARHVAVWDVALLTNLDSQIRPPITRFIPSSTGQHILANSAAGKIECFHIGRRSYHIPHAHFPASFSPDGSLVATASWPSGDNLDILIVDAASGELRQRLREGGVATATLSFSPGNEYMIATSNDGSPKLWDIATGRLHRLGQLWAQFSRGGAQVTCVSKSGFVQTLDYRTGEVTNTPDLDSLAGPVDTVVFSPDGDTFAVIHLVNSITIRAHGQSDFTLVCPTVQYSAITSLVFSGDGMRLASSSHNLVCMWDLQRRCLVWDRRLPVSLPVNAVTLGRMHLLSLSHDETILHVLAADTGLLLSSHSLPIYRNAGIKSVALSWDETQAVLFSANIGGEMVELSSGMMSYFSSELPPIVIQPPPINSYQTYTSGPLTAYSLDGGTATCTNRCHGFTLVNTEISHVRSVAGEGEPTLPTFSQDGQRFACVMDSTTIKIWEMVTGNMLEWSFAHPAMVVSLAFSPLATHIITAMEDSSAWMWDLTDGSLVAAVYCHEIMSAVFLGDHLKAILQGPLHLQLWDTTYYGPTTPLYDTNTPFEEPLMMSSDRSRLLCGRTVYLVGTVAPTTLQKSFDLPSECDVGVFSPDGRYVACWAKHLPSRISVVAVTDGSSKCEIECSYGRPFASVAFNVESTHLLVLLENSSVHIWDLSNPPRPTKVLPILFPKDPTLLQSRLRDGWLLGEDGQPLIWLPDSMQKVRLLSAYRHGRLVLEDTNGGPIVLDMADYLKIPQAAGGWRDGDVEILGSNNEASVLHRGYLAVDMPRNFGVSSWELGGGSMLSSGTCVGRLSE